MKINENNMEKPTLNRIVFFCLLLSNCVISQTNFMGDNAFKFLYYQLLSESSNRFDVLHNKIKSNEITLDSNIVVFSSKRIDSILVYDSVIVKVEQKRNKLRVYECYDKPRELEFVYNSRKKIRYINVTCNGSVYVLDLKNHSLLDVNNNNKIQISDAIEDEYLMLFKRYYQCQL